jgi:nucleoside-diphosphate-sugar epimerase
MRVFVAGASGALGRPLVRQLIEAGHEVTGTHHSAASEQLLAALGAEPVRLDLLDPDAVRAAVLASRPEAIVHQATALTGASFGRNLDKTFTVTNRLRTEGTDALLAAAREAGVRRFVAQSFAPYLYAREGGPVKTEADPVDQAPPPNTGRTYAAITYLERAATGFGGIALRYGGFYGAANDALIEPVRKRQFPVVGEGGGIFPWLHVEDGAAATVLALEHAGPALYNVVDDDSAPVRDWLPVLASALGARPPRHVPAWLARLAAGPAAVVLATQARGAANTRARRELGWVPRYPSWREGFPAAYAALPAAGTRRAGAEPSGSG